MLLVLEVAVIRPPLNARTELVLAGVDEGGSIWHYLYIAADGAIFVLLVAFLILAVRRLIPAAAASESIQGAAR